MKKRKYLFRLAVIIIVLMIVPMIGFFDLFWKKSFDEVERQNEAYYNKILNSYVSFYDELMHDLTAFATNISVESKEAGKNVPWKKVEEIQEDYYHLYKVATALDQRYKCEDISEWGIYLYDIDRVIRGGYTLTSAQFIQELEIQFGHNEQLSQFFQIEHYHPGDKLFGSTSVDEFENGYLLLGVCVEIGVDRDKALVYFKISSEDIGDSLVIMNEQGMEFYLVDEQSGKALLFWGDKKGADSDHMLSLEETLEIAGRRQTVLYKKNCCYTDFSIVLYISENAMLRNVVDYAYDMRNLWLTASVVLFCLCMCAVFFAYSPVYRLTSTLDYQGEDEFGSIQNLLEERHSRIKEQEMLIMDLLVNHLIYGVHVSEKRIKRLGVESFMKCFCVFYLNGYILASAEAEKIVTMIEKQYCARIFVTDWQGTNNSVLILFSGSPDIQKVEACLKSWLKHSFVEPCELYTGKVVERLDDIQMSLRSCLDQAAKKHELEERKMARLEAANAREEMQRKLKEEILAYLELHYRNPDLNQAQIADIFRISVYTLSRLFKNQVGVGFTEYLVAKRIESAKELLLVSSYSINEIAAMTGFSSGNHFSKSFKLYVGVSPSVFREKI